MQQHYLSLPFAHNSFPCPRIRGTIYIRRHPSSNTTVIPFFAGNRQNLPLITNPASQNGVAFSFSTSTNTSAGESYEIERIDNDSNPTKEIHDGNGKTKGKSFWGAVSLIIGTAVGPGMLGLPALTIKSGPFPSTILILLSWVYVISSIILVAELSFSAMEEDGIEEVSFTSLATKALGSRFGAFVALVYTSLSFSLLVACVAGIGSIFSPWFPPWLNSSVVYALFPLIVGILIVFFPFKTVDFANRILCFIMLFSITALVAVGISVARANIVSSFAYASWSLSSILPVIPVAVLTLGFHVITPFICKIVGNTIDEARKAILIGGVVPLVMVLSWNLIVLGLVGASNSGNSKDPISLLLSVNPSALSAVQGFAFSAMATSLIGYAVSLPKQLLDTWELLISGKSTEASSNGNGRVGLVFYSGGSSIGCSGKVSFRSSRNMSLSKSDTRPTQQAFDTFKVLVTIFVLAFSVLIASFFRSTFSRALDFAGVYANCFLFGIIPPVMAYIHQSKKKLRYG
ncbi:tyrosine-specific transport protein [Senna tora]|uniref:Tyrosine-specific transport protein n=1 Tax=Senna tora TaxID=362788 RepID=A0A834VYP6_9FABA|nr:tyrosine-specific transport protein [Senna tora]